MLQLLKIWSLQESLSRVKENEGNTQSISCLRKGTLKESQKGQNKLLLLRQGNNILHNSCTYHVYIVSVHILHIYFLEDNMFKEKLYLWKNKKIRIAITMTTSQEIHMKGWSTSTNPGNNPCGSYYISNSCKISQNQNQSWRNLEEVKDRKKSAIKRKLEKHLWHFAEGNKDADGSMDSPRWREPII